jgi:hypothetical protein
VVMRAARATEISLSSIASNLTNHVSEFVRRADEVDPFGSKRHSCLRSFELRASVHPHFEETRNVAHLGGSRSDKKSEGACHSTLALISSIERRTTRVVYR